MKDETLRTWLFEDEDGLLTSFYVDQHTIETVTANYVDDRHKTVTLTFEAFDKVTGKTFPDKWVSLPITVEMLES